jgi:hypothetical protein
VKAGSLDCLGEADGTQVPLAENNMIKYANIASVAAARLAGSRLSKPTLAAGSARLTAKK